MQPHDKVNVPVNEVEVRSLCGQNNVFMDLALCMGVLSC